MLNPNELKLRKGNLPIAMITAYDACFARIAEASGIDMILVGDSGANVVLGYASTREIGMDEMLMFVGAVRRGATSTHIVADMPWQSDRDPSTAVMNAKRLLAAGAHSVKVEGADLNVIEALIRNNISVVGHLGLLPQTATSFKQQGQSSEEAEKILTDARAIAQLGIIALVLEHIPERLGYLVSQALPSIPTIGIGAGKLVDGQVLVLHDALGMHPYKVPPFAHKFTDLYAQSVEALKCYVQAVRDK